MDLICSATSGTNGKGWRDFFRGALDARPDKVADSDSQTSSRKSSQVVLASPHIKKSKTNKLPIRAKYLSG